MKARAQGNIGLCSGCVVIQRRKQMNNGWLFLMEFRTIRWSQS